MTTWDVLADEWLVTTLDGDATLEALAPHGVWLHPAPQSTPPLHVTYQTVPNNDTVVVDRQRVLARGLWRVLVWWDNGGSWADARAAVARIDALLHGAEYTGGGIHLHAQRERPETAVDVNGDEAWHGRGAWYRFVAHAA